MKLQINKNSDLVGILASGLCIVHCAIAPVIFAARPLFSGHGHNHTSSLLSWDILDFFFLGLSLVAVIYSANHTRNKLVKLGFWASWLLFAGGLAGEHYALFNGDWMMYAGSGMLVGLHLINYQMTRSSSRKLALS